MTKLAQSPDPAQNAAHLHRDSLLRVVNILTYPLTVSSALVNSSTKNYTFAIPHGMNFIPNVIGTFTQQHDTAIRPLPYFFRNSSSYYLGDSASKSWASASVVIDSIDATNINVRMDYLDLTGLSWLLYNDPGTFTFKFYVLAEPTING